MHDLWCAKVVLQTTNRKTFTIHRSKFVVSTSQMLSDDKRIFRGNLVVDVDKRERKVKIPKFIKTSLLIREPSRHAKIMQTENRTKEERKMKRYRSLLCCCTNCLASNCSYTVEKQFVENISITNESLTSLSCQF